MEGYCALCQSANFSWANFLCFFAAFPIIGTTCVSYPRLAYKWSPATSKKSIMRRFFANLLSKASVTDSFEGYIVKIYRNFFVFKWVTKLLKIYKSVHCLKSLWNYSWSNFSQASRKICDVSRDYLSSHIWLASSIQFSEATSLIIVIIAWPRQLFIILFSY